MSKKKFTDGLESLFGHSEGGNLQEGSPLLVETRKKERKNKKKNKGKQRSSKNFTSDLDSLFEDALKETLEEKVEKIVKDKVKISPARKARPRAVFGLDALIRRTSDSSDFTESEQSHKKRVTFIFDKQKLLKLKKIAKTERAYLKDIIGDVMAEYIEEYENIHGNVE